MSSDDIEGLVDEVITELESLDGVQTWPGATEKELATAERHIGAPLPDDHKAFLRRTNGISFGYGWERFFGVGDNVPVDLIWFNTPSTWKFAYGDRPDLRNYLYVGSGDIPMTTAYRGYDLRENPASADLYSVSPEIVPGKSRGVRSARSLASLRTLMVRGWAKKARNILSDRVSSQFVRKFGNIAMDKAVVPGFNDYFPPGGDITHQGAELTDLRLAYVFYADLNREASSIDEQLIIDGRLEILGWDIVDDPRGVPRATWRTNPPQTPAT